MVENIKIQVEILKVKLAFFVGLAGGSFYMLINMYKYIQKLEFGLFVIILLSVSLLYSFIGVFVNLLELNRKYKELECLKSC